MPPGIGEYSRRPQDLRREVEPTVVELAERLVARSFADLETRRFRARSLSMEGSGRAAGFVGTVSKKGRSVASQS